MAGVGSSVFPPAVGRLTTSAPDSFEPLRGVLTSAKYLVFACAYCRLRFIEYSGFIEMTAQIVSIRQFYLRWIARLVESATPWKCWVVCQEE